MRRHVQEQGERIERDDNAHVRHSGQPDLDIGNATDDLSPLELFFFKVHDDSVMSDGFDFDFFALFLGVTTSSRCNPLSRFGQGRISGDRGRLTEAPD